MSFSSEVKEELSRQVAAARHCCIAEMAAIISLCGHVKISGENRYSVKINTENISVARKYFTLLKKTFKISVDINTREHPGMKKNHVYVVEITDADDAIRVLKATNHGVMLQKS